MGWIDQFIPKASTTREELSLGRRHRPDYWLIALVMILLTVGLIVIFSISPALSAVSHNDSNYYVVKQLIAIGIGLVALIATATVPLHMWRKFAVPLVVLAGVLTLLAIVLPVNPNYPAHRWVRLGILSFQSVELMKFALLVWLSGLLYDRLRDGTIRDMQQTLKPIAIAVGVIGFVVVIIQSDLGSMGVILSMVTAMLFIAGLPLKRLLLIAGIIGIGVVLAISITPYRRERLFSFLNPTADCQNAGYQACQALIAVGSGGMAGLGLGSSVQAYGYLPEASNDSIFAIYAEKFGFIGCIALLGVLVALFARIKRIAERAPDDFSRLLVVGVFVWLGVQTMINIGAMIGVLPLKGITLPFVSYGGTSVVFVLAAVGLLFQVSHYTLYDVRMSQTRQADRLRPGTSRIRREARL